MKNTQLNRTFFAGLIVAVFCACSPFATDEPPGVGEKAEKGYAACAPVIAALENYKESNGAYPNSLAELVPDYISAVPTEVNDIPITYEKVDESYTLSFGYTGPGMNRCTYSPEENWHCSGAY